ncbi:MAG: LON peptidase substrate-binding domain-containing protein [Burkholderiales bacterium]|nr:LON peptidase substrate-binding domain-containing protein [Burkholderiales bacterium]MDP3715785.1 LON peptidase substrate-binding domain-containing protein [Burkholderiales bacterium]
MSSDIRELPLFPLGTVLFPGGLLPLKIFEQRYVDMTKACLRDSTPFGVCLIKEGREVGEPAAPHAVGCLAQIEQWDVPHPNLFAVLARGGARFRILGASVGTNGLITGRIEMLPEPTRPETVDRACQEVLRLAIERAGADSVPGPIQLDDALWVSYRLAEILPISPPEKQALLEMDDTAERLAQLQALLLSHGIIENINKNK